MEDAFQRRAPKLEGTERLEMRSDARCLGCLSRGLWARFWRPAALCLRGRGWSRRQRRGARALHLVVPWRAGRVGLLRGGRGGQVLTTWGGDVARPPAGTAVRLGAAGVQCELAVSGDDEMVKGASEGWGTKPPAALPVEKPRSPGGASEKDPDGADWGRGPQG